MAGIAVGVALLFASQVANTSLSGSVSRLTNDLVGSARLQLVGRSPSGFSEDYLSRVQGLPGVKLAAPVLEREVNVAGPGGAQDVDLIGLNAAFLGLQSRLLSHVNPEQIGSQRGLAMPFPVVERIGAKALDPIDIHAGSRNIKVKLAVVLRDADIGAAVRSPVAIMPLGEAQVLMHSDGRINRILVEPEPKKDRNVAVELERLADGLLNVRPANFEATVFDQAEGPAVQSTELFSAISALVGFLFAFNAMLLTVPQRRKLIADLRLDGYSVREIAEVMMFDVLMLGAAGVLAGLLLGDLLSHSLLRTQPGYLSLAFPVGSQRFINVSSALIAAAGGMTAALLGVMVPLRHEIVDSKGIGSVGSTAAPARRSSRLVLFGCGVACIGLSLVVTLAGVRNVGEATVAFLGLTAAMLFILPAAFTSTLSIVDRTQRPIMGVSSRIALIELLSNATRSRSLAIAATGAVAVFGSVSIEGAQGSLREGLKRAAGAVSRGVDLWVTPPGNATTLATTPFDNVFARRLAVLGGVNSVGEYRGGFLDIGSRRVMVLAPPRSDSRLVSASQTITGDVRVALARLRSTGWLTISRELANVLKLNVGSRLLLQSPRPTYLRVAAITTNFGWSPGAIVMNATDYERAWNSHDVSAYVVTLRRGGSLSGAIHEVREALSPSGLVVQSATRHEQNEVAGQRQGLARLTAIAALVLLAAALAMAAVIGAMIWQRRPRLAGMKVDGFSERELWLALLYESLLLLAVGCTVGAVFGLFGQALLSHALANVTGFPVYNAVAVDVAVASVGAVTVIALLVVAVPGYLAVRIRPAVQD